MPHCLPYSLARRFCLTRPLSCKGPIAGIVSRSFEAFPLDGLDRLDTFKTTRVIDTTRTITRKPASTELDELRGCQDLNFCPKKMIILLTLWRRRFSSETTSFFYQFFFAPLFRQFAWNWRNIRYGETESIISH